MADSLGFMTVGDLRRALEPFSDDMQIVVSTFTDGEGETGEEIDFTCSLASVSYETACGENGERGEAFLRFVASDEPNDEAPESGQVS